MSYFWTFLMIVISVVIVEAEYIRFNLDKARLTQCIETYFLKDPSFKAKEFSHFFADIIAEKFYDKSMPRDKFLRETHVVFYGINNRKSHAHIDKKVMQQLKEVLRRALEDCVERKNLPVFKHETPEMRAVLDYILVDFPQFLFSMIRTRSGRSELRAYVKAAIVSLMSALDSYDRNIDAFRHELRRFWLLRAQRFFDSRDMLFRYIRHTFTNDRHRNHSFVRLNDVHTRDDLDLFVGRGDVSFQLRNSPAYRHDFGKILRTHYPGLSQPRDLVYDSYELCGMTSAEFYFENHVDQFYRIIFFILELEMRGITDEESDIYEGMIPDSVMFNYTQEIIWIDRAYRNYLEYLSEELDFTSGREEDFVMFFLQWIEDYKSFTAEITTSTTTTGPWSTTPRDFQGPGKKGGVRDKDYGKHFLPKRPRTNSDNQGLQSFTNVGNNHFYGCVVFDDDIDQLVFPEDKPSAFLKVIRDAQTCLNSLGRFALSL